MNRLKVVIDTNVLISGTFWAGFSSHILELVEEKKIIFILSSDILSEYNEVMNYEEIKQKIKHHNERMQAVHKLFILGKLTEPQEKIEIIKDDKSDNKFLEAAIAGNADYIVTRDEKHILPLKEFRGIKIVAPEDFLKIFNQYISSEDPINKDWNNEADENWNKL